MPWVGVGFQTLTCTRPPGPQDHLQFPDVPDVPASAQDLIRQLLCHQEARLGRRGLDDFRNHPFFEGVDWERLATSTAPYIPELRGPMDTSNFDVDDDTLNHPVSGGTHSSSGCGTLPCPAKFPKAVAGLGMGGPWELWFTWAGSPALKWIVPSEGSLTTCHPVIQTSYKKTPGSTCAARTSKTCGSCSLLRAPGSRTSTWSCTSYSDSPSPLSAGNPAATLPWDLLRPPPAIRGLHLHLRQVSSPHTPGGLPGLENTGSAAHQDPGKVTECPTCIHMRQMLGKCALSPQ